MAFKMKGYQAHDKSPMMKEGSWWEKAKAHKEKIQDILDPEYSFGPGDYIKKAKEKNDYHYGGSGEKEKQDKKEEGKK